MFRYLCRCRCFTLWTVWDTYNYRPQRSCGQGNIFAPVCHSVHRRVSASVHAEIPQPPPPPADTPQSRHPTGADTPPWSRPPPKQTWHPREQTCPPREQTCPPRADTPPGADTPPPHEADLGIRSMSGRYASYWNAFLLKRQTTIYLCFIFTRLKKTWRKL